MDPRSSDAQGGVAGVRARLLLVEDEFLIRLTLAETLGDAGYDVAEAEDVDEALARRVRELHPDLPVIFMTGRPDPGRDGALGSRREVFISKPYLPSEVCAAVARLLGG